jgi:hypothetical protein
MAIVINANDGTISGISVGGLPDGTVDAGTLASGIDKTSITDGGNSTAITIDASENVGIGVTPEAWQSTRNTLQIGAGAVFANGTGAGSDVEITQNAYYDGSWKYINTDEASRHYQNSGTHIFDVAASGSADAAITWTTAMTIDNSGRVIQHKKMYSIYKSYGGSTGDLTGGTLEDSEGISFNTTTGRWTAPIAGLYQLGGSFYTDGDTLMEVYVKKNGTGTAFLNNLTANRNSFGYSVSTIMYLAANDTVGFSTLKGTIRSAASDWRWIFRVG